MTEHPRRLDGTETRRSVMQKGAIAAGALALGGTAGVGTVATQDGPDQTAVNAFRFYPGADFDVVGRLRTETTVDLLQVDDDTVDELSQPDEWSGHVIRYGIGEEAGIVTVLFTRNHRMSIDDGATLGVDASTLSGDLNLLNVSIDGAGGDGADAEVDEEEGDEGDDEEMDGDEEGTNGADDESDGADDGNGGD